MTSSFDNPEELLQGLLETSPAGISVTSVDDVRLYVNEKFLELYGYENVDAALGLPSRENFLSDEDYQRVEAAFRRDGALISLEIQQACKGGEA